MTVRARISGTGMYVPERVVTNQDLVELMDTSDEWIRQRTGIQERRFISEGQTPVDLAEPAARRALAAGWGVDPAKMQSRMNLLFPGKYPDVPQGGAIWVFAVK